MNSAKIADATNDVFIKTVTSVVKPFLARMRKDEEEWAISKPRTCIEASRTQERRKRVTMNMKSPEQKRMVIDSLTDRSRRHSLSLTLKLAKKRHEKDRIRIFGKPLNDALKNGEARARHRLSRPLAMRGMRARRKNQDTIAAKMVSVTDVLCGVN